MSTKLQDRLPSPPTPEDFPSRLRSPAIAARVGLWLGIAFGTCFLTGLVSHYAQNVDQPIPFPTHPYWIYRVTQGLHVISGTAAIPLLIVKLWAVYPKLFDIPSLKHPRELLVSSLEKASIGVLVSSGVFELVTGLQNITHWYTWGFSFRATHYAVGWVAIGALLVHIAVKLPIIRDVLGGHLEETMHDRETAVEHGALSRRGLLRTTWLATGVAVLATAGNSVPYLRKISIFAVRTGSDGHGNPPINKSALAAHITDDLVNPATYRLEVTYGDTSMGWSMDELAGMTQRTVSLPIACVEGWSAQAVWTGVRLRDILDQVGAPRGKDVVVRSLQPSGPYRATYLQDNFVDDDRTLVALKINGDTLSRDHGFPCRLIAPDRPGVLQTKWLATLEVQA